MAEAQEILTPEHTCLLLVSLRFVLSPHEYPAEGDGERVDGEGEGAAEDAGDQTKCRRERGALACYVTDRCRQVSRFIH